MAANWGYKKENGPDQWHQWYPVAKQGVRQSPVDIKTCDCKEDSALKPVEVKYNPNNCTGIENTGASWKLNINPDGSSLKGGPLDSEYKVLQIHAHWGAVNGRGSEHTLDGKNYDAELHIVHYNSKYGEPGDALDKPDGLAVLGMFIEVGKAHPEIEKLCQSLEDIQLKGNATAVQEPIDPEALLPADRGYYTYPGSLTTPPLFESVTWIVFKNPIQISAEQLKEMRALSISADDENDDDLMVDNYRPPCPLGERAVRLCQLPSSSQPSKCPPPAANGNSSTSNKGGCPVSDMLSNNQNLYIMLAVLAVAIPVGVYVARKL